MIAKPTTNQAQESFYELFVDKEITTKDGSIVTIEESIGIYSLDNLNVQKSNLQKQIESIDTKILAINSL